MAPTYKTFEALNIAPITRDGSLQWSPDSKYLSLATTDHIVIVRVNMDMLKFPIPNYFHSKTLIDFDKSHGAHLAGKMIPLKSFIKQLPLTEINKLVSDVKVDSDMFVSNADMRKFRWSPPFISNHCLIGALNSLGLLEIIYYHDSGHDKLFKINHLWYKNHVKKYVKMHAIPKRPNDLKKIITNVSSLLWIESFVWIPMTDPAHGLLLVCYHHRGLLTVWNVNQKILPHDELAVESDTPDDNEMRPKSDSPEKKGPQAEVSSNFVHECNLLKIITVSCNDPFSRQNLILKEFEEKQGERILNMDYLNLNGKHMLCLSQSNGILKLFELNVSVDHPFKIENDVDSAQDKSITLNALFAGPTLNTTSCNSGRGILSDEELVLNSSERGRSNQDKGHEDCVTDTLENAGKPNETKVQPRTEKSSQTVISDKDSKVKSAKGRKRKQSLSNEDHESKKTKTYLENPSGNSTETNMQISEKCISVGTGLACIDGNTDTQNIADCKALHFNVFDRKDLVPPTNLVLTESDENVILIFSKTCSLHCIVLNKNGRIIDQFCKRMRTRCITAIAPYRKNIFLLGTHENKLLVVSIDTGMKNRDLKIDARDVVKNDFGAKKTIKTYSKKDSSSSLESGKDSPKPDSRDLSKTDPRSLSPRIVVTRSIDMSNETHLLNGIVNSTNSYFTVLSFKVKVRFETYYTSSRNPCFLLLTSLYSPTSLVGEKFPSVPLYKQTDLIKCISSYKMNIVRHNLLDGVTDAKMKYFFIKLLKPDNWTQTMAQQAKETLATLEKAIYLRHIKKCVSQGIFSENKDVLVLFRQWILFNFPNQYPKLIAQLPTDSYGETCYLCAGETKVESLRVAMCSSGHQVLRCSLSLAQCLGSYVRCNFCLAYASTLYSEDPRLDCVFCGAKFPSGGF